MDLGNPIRSVIPSSHGPVLEVLARTTAPLTGRTVAALTGNRVSPAQANRALQELVDAGVVLCADHPPAHLYRLNRDHVAAHAIQALAQLRDALIERIHQKVAGWERAPEAVWIFGSFARGEGTSSSDIDLLILKAAEPPETEAVSTWEEQVIDLTENVLTWSGNDCRIAEYTSSEYSDLVARGERLPQDVARDGIRLFGMDIPRPSREQDR